MSDISKIIERIKELETERDNTPIWRLFKICEINQEIHYLYSLCCK